MRETLLPAIRLHAHARQAATAGVAWIAAVLLALACLLAAPPAGAQATGTAPCCQAADRDGARQADSQPVTLQDAVFQAAGAERGPAPGPAPDHEPLGSAFEAESNDHVCWPSPRPAHRVRGRASGTRIPANTLAAPRPAAELMPPAHAPPAIA